MKAQGKETPKLSLAYTISVALGVLFLMILAVITTQTGMLPFLLVLG